MTKCPYPEILIDDTSDTPVSNEQYKYWHEGYEAHKLEMMDFSREAVCPDRFIQQDAGKNSP